MTNIIVHGYEEAADEVKALIAKIEALGSNASVQKVETKVLAVESSAVEYIKENGLHDAYQIALNLLKDAAEGQGFVAMAKDLYTQVVAAGIAIAKGAESIILAQAQADLVAQSDIVAPSTGAHVVPPVDSPAPVSA